MASGNRTSSLRSCTNASRGQAQQSDNTGRRTSPYAEILQTGFRSLRFPGDIEDEFRHARGQIARRRLATVDLLAALGVVAWIALDALTLREFQFPLAWTGLGAWIAVLLGHFLALRFLPDRIYPFPSVWITFAVDLVGCGVLIWLGLLMDLRGMPGSLFLYLALLTFTSAQFLLSVMTWKALAAGLLVAIAYGLGHALMGPASGHAVALPLPHAMFFLVAIILIGASIGWQREYAARRQFLLAKLLKEASEHDSLTGLMNHGAFVTHAEHVWQQAAREGKRIGLVIGDIDHFKRYNDRYGHPAGDECLVRVARVFSEAAGRGLDAAGRLGGEEFAVLWYDVTEPATAGLAERLRNEIAGSVMGRGPDGAARKVTISLGTLCTAPKDGQDGQHFTNALRAADEALYRAKDTGRNRVAVAASGQDF